LELLKKKKTSEPIIDIETGEEIVFEKPEIRYPEPLNFPEAKPREPREKIYVNGVDVSVLISRELHFDQHGKPITTSLKDHTKEIIAEGLCFFR
jgi:type I restriction enzyme R subunit